MMIGYVDLDVPVGSPPLVGSELRPASIRASQAVLQAVRRMARGNAPGAGPNPPPGPGRNRSRPPIH
jgi:hypothetical protein